MSDKEEVKQNKCNTCGASVPEGYALCDECLKKNKYKSNAVNYCIISIVIFFVLFFGISFFFSINSGKSSNELLDSYRFTTLLPSFLLSCPTLIASTINAKKADVKLLFFADIMMIIYGLILIIIG